MHADRREVIAWKFELPALGDWESYPSLVTMPQSNEELYASCRSTLACIEALGNRNAIIAQIGSPEKTLPIGNFFVTDPTDQTVTYCDLVELHQVGEFVIRIGYINEVVKKVRGMPKIHWRDLE